MLGSMVNVLTLVLVLCGAGFNGVCCLAGDATKPAAKEMEGLWKDLLEGEPVSTRAVLAMARTPEETTVFLAARLKPLTLSKERLESLLVQLGSDKKEEWQAAFHELEYFDPRLAMGLDELLGLKAVQEYPARHRLVDVLSGLHVDADGKGPFHRYKLITLSPVGADAYNFVGSDRKDAGGGAYWAEAKVERLNEYGGNPKREWTRIVRALALLESIGAEDALAVIDAVAAGHPEAQPTKVANEMLARMTKR